MGNSNFVNNGVKCGKHRNGEYRNSKELAISIITKLIVLIFYLLKSWL